jgi:hypothetical protein
MNEVYVDYNDLKDFKFYNFGAESDIYRSKDKKLIFKKFRINVTDKQLNNKREKLLLLRDEKEIDDICVIPKYLVMNKNILIGAIMDYFRGDTLFDESLCLTISDKTNILNFVRDCLFRFKQKDILYLDLSLANILNKIYGKNFITKFIDMDNIAYRNLPVDKISFRLKAYLERGGQQNFEAIIFLFNWMTYVFLTNGESNLELNANTYIKELEKIDLSNKGVLSFCHSLFNKKADQIGDHEFLIDYVVDRVKSK